MKVFIIDNNDSRYIFRESEMGQALKCELDSCQDGDYFSVECKEMTEEEVAAIPEE